MHKNFQNTNGYIRLITEEERGVGDRLLRYRLYEIFCDDLRVQYAVAVSTYEEARFVSLGEDSALSGKIYRAMVAGGVTPCTACDVVSDSLKEEYLY